MTVADPAAPAAAPSKVLVYDGDCSMCDAASRAVLAWAHLPPTARASHLTFEGDVAVRLDQVGIRNEMAVISPETGEIRSGLPAILWFLRGTRWGWLASTLDHAALRGPLSVLYRWIAYNRRVIAPVPPRAFACACDPDPSPGFNASFTTALALFAAYGAWAAAWYVLEAAGRPAASSLFLPGLVLLALIAVAALAPRGRRVAAHAAWVAMTAGLPSALVSSLALWLSMRRLIEGLGGVEASDPWRLPAWFLIAPALGLVTGTISLRRRWHLIRPLWRGGAA